ncbi:hypothetical protein HDU76_008824 [Blyttiomyces sp. JEL0837]|nr:hypothetical protein HDU76_008824 [Blyttiomyces sp. JEL0837]
MAFVKLLRSFYFSDNLMGPLPQGIGNLQQLEYMDFSACINMNGPLPESFTKLTNLNFLYVLIDLYAINLY